MKSKHSKVLVVAAVGLGVGGLVWWFTRSQGQPAPTPTQTALQGIRALRGFTQSLAYDNANTLKPLAQAGLQRLIFRRTM